MEAKQFGNYTLVERISHGGMAEVYRAKSFGEAGFEREVALKMLLPQIASDSEFITMLIDEAKIAGQLNHTNIAQIFDLGVTDGRYYIVQEYVHGQDLRAILRHKAKSRTHFEIATACYVALKVCEGLHYAHNKKDNSGSPLKVVHRDISPHNILISSGGEVKIIDFGIAKAEGRSTQTLAGLVKGKFAYMSPEQIRGLPVDHRSDVFATGILLYEMLTTRSLFRRSTEFETLKQARSAKANPPSYLRAEIPPALDAIVLKALARHVHDRYQSADEFRNALWAFARDHDAYRRGGILSEISQGRPGTAENQDLSLQIVLASEVSAIDEVLVDTPVPQIEATEPDLEHDFENSTIVEARSPFQPSPPGPAVPKDEDAKWAADVGGPLSNGLPARITRSRQATAETNVEADEYGQGQVDVFDEPTVLPPPPEIDALATSKFAKAPPAIAPRPAEAYDIARATTEAIAVFPPNPAPPGMAAAALSGQALPAADFPSATNLPSPAATLNASKSVATPLPIRPSGSQSGPMPLPVGPQPGSQSGPMPMPVGAQSGSQSGSQAGSQSGPMPMPGQALHRAPVYNRIATSSDISDSATEAVVTYRQPVGSGPTTAKTTPNNAKSQRLYWVIGALLFLLLSSAASISLLVG